MGYARKDVEATKRTPIGYFLLIYCYTKNIICSIGNMKTAMAKMRSSNTKKKVLSTRVSDQLYAQLLAYAEKTK